MPKDKFVPVIEVPVAFQKFMKQILLLICLLNLVACNARTERNKILVENNFDGLEGWGVAHPSLTNERAFSGKYALKAGDSIEYSLGINQQLGKLTGRKPEKIKVELKAYIQSSNAKAKFVCLFSDTLTNATIFYHEFNLPDKTLDYREWVTINKRIDLPEEIKLSHNFRCYLWRSEPTRELVFIDDLRITVLK
ncbi:MAG TPA: hypothetical protein VK927_06865 [Adhaeribacter sp.]|nr:hypothetical protein [Adhaeribacter sp.]